MTHLFFDLDHTLWDFEKNSDKTFEFLFKKHQIPCDLEKFLYYYRNINVSYWERYRKNEVSKEVLKTGRLNDTFDKIKVSISDELIQLLAEEYLLYLPKNNHLFEGTIETLTYLKNKYHLHLITNGFNEVQYEKIKNSNLEPYFEQIITSEDIGVKKPDPAIFDFALKKANATKKESVMIGDNWEADVMGALQFGMKAIYFNPENKIVGESITSISSLLELKKLF